MKKELMNILHFHSTLDTFLDKFVPKSAMPEEYGGSAGQTKSLCEAGYANLQANEKFFHDEELSYRVNEKLRQGKPHGDGDIFGIEGNFKQLSFD